jgi:FYVE zinc finger
MADQETNGFVFSPPKPATTSDADKHFAAPPTPYTDEHSPMIPQNISILNNVTDNSNENSHLEQEAPPPETPGSPTDSGLAASPERQHLDQVKDNEQDSVTEHGISDQQASSIEDNKRPGSSDPAPGSTQVTEAAPTDPEGEVTNSAAASENGKLQDDYVREHDTLEDQSSSGDQLISLEPEVDRDSSDQLGTLAPGEPEITYAVPPPPSLPSDTVNASPATDPFQSPNEIIEANSSQVFPSTLSSTLLHPPPPVSVLPRSQSQSLTISTSSVWEADKDASECRRCKRRFNFLVRRHHCR